MYSSNGLSIRKIERSDLEFMKEIRNDYSTWRFLTSIGMFTDENQEEWFAAISSSSKVEYYIVSNEDGTDIGYIRCDEIDRTNSNIRVGSDIHMKFRNMGYGKRTYRLILDYCFNHLNVHRVWLQVMETNEIALRVYRDLGFREEGRMRESIYREGKYHDYIVMSILRGEYSDDSSV